MKARGKPRACAWGLDWRGRTHGVPGSRRCATRGFTLVEVLLALTISALLAVSVVSATRTLSSTRQSVDRRVERATSGRRAMEIVVAALRNVRRDPLPSQPIIVGRSGGRGARRDRIDLQTITDRRARPDGAESDQYEIGFYLAKPSGRQLPVLMRRQDHALDEHPDDGGIATVVAEGIVGLSFEYFADGQWSDEWPEAEPRTPEAVRVTVAAVGPESRNSRRLPKPFELSTVVPIHVNPPIPQPPDPNRDRERANQPESERPSPGGPQL